MVAIELDAAAEKQLQVLAESQGADPKDIARRILEDYLVFTTLNRDTPEEWAEASVKLAAEFAIDESWPEATE